MFIFCAAPPSADPIQKNKILNIINGLRPKILLREPQAGMNAAWERA